LRQAIIALTIDQFANLRIGAAKQSRNQFVDVQIGQSSIQRSFIRRLPA
jgi:hypothetical protein